MQEGQCKVGRDEETGENVRYVGANDGNRERRIAQIKQNAIVIRRNKDENESMCK